MCLPAGFYLPDPHWTLITGRVSRFKNRWSKIACPRHQDILENGIPLDWIYDTPPPNNRPFDSARSLSPSNFEACSQSLQHQIDIGLRVPNKHIQYEHFKMERLHTA